MTLAIAPGSTAPAITSGGRNELSFAVAISCGTTALTRIACWRSSTSRVRVRCTSAALTEVDPTPYWVNYGPNVWAAVKGYLGTVTELATKPVVAKYTGVLGSADVEESTYSTTFMIMQSMRLDLGAGSQVHP